MKVKLTKKQCSEIDCWMDFEKFTPWVDDKLKQSDHYLVSFEYSTEPVVANYTEYDKKWWLSFYADKDYEIQCVTHFTNLPKKPNNK